jgi:DNA polymerase-3 subunit gamma/tau
VESVRAMLGSVDRSHAERFVRALAVRDGRAVLDGVDALREHGLSAAGTLEELAALLQQMAIEQAVPGALPEDDPDTPLTRELASLLPADETQLLYSFVLHGRHELTLAPDAYAGLAMVLLRLLAFAPAAGGGAPARAAPAAGSAAPVRATAGSAALVRPAAPRSAATTPTLAAAARPLAQATSPPSVVRPPREQAPPPWLDDVPPDDDFDGVCEPQASVSAAAAAVPAAATLEPTPLGDRWQALVAMLNERQAISALARELAMQAQLLEQHDGAQPLWRLRVERESLRAEALVEKLRAALAETVGIPPLRLEVEAGAVTDSPARRDAAERERRQREAEAIIHNDPLVKEMLAQFPSARIVPGSIKPH